MSASEGYLSRPLGEKFFPGQIATPTIAEAYTMALVMLNREVPDDVLGEFEKSVGGDKVIVGTVRLHNETVAKKLDMSEVASMALSISLELLHAKGESPRLMGKLYMNSLIQAMQLIGYEIALGG